MLKTMRRNIKSLKYVMWIVVATFIISIFVVWGGSGRLGGGGGGNTVAVVGGQKISADEFQNGLRNRIEALKREMKDINRGFIEQLQIPQQVMQNMIEQKILFALAREMGVRASDAELREKITALPGLQRDGQFIGYKEYRELLGYYHQSIPDFEASLRDNIVLDKMVKLLTAGTAVTPEEAWANYQKTKDSVKLEYLVLEKTKVELDKTPTEAEARAYFEGRKDAYKVPERREGRYVFLKNDDLKKEVELSESEIEKYYKDNLSEFQVPEQLKVSRIFLPFAGRDKAIVQAEAENALARVKAGDDFAGLAKTFSKDDKAKDGGDWGLYDWKSLAAKEQDEIKKLEAGKTSGLIALEDGLAIIKVTQKDAPSTTPLESAKPRIRSTLQDTRARGIAAERIARLEKEAKKAKALDGAAATASLKVQSTGLIKVGEPLAEIDPSGSVSAALFGLKDKEISGPVYTYGGTALVQLQKIEAPRPATFEEVKADVEKDLVEARKKELVLARMKKAKAELKDANWEDVAQKHKLEIKTADEHKREQYLTLIGESAEVDAQAFRLPLKQASEPIEIESGYAVLRVLDRKEAVRADFEKDKAAEIATLLEQKQNKFLQAYVAKIRAEKDVKINSSKYSQIVQDVLSRYDTASEK